MLIDVGSHVGIKVRGGREFGLGVFVTCVDRSSPAELTGLKVRICIKKILCEYHCRPTMRQTHTPVCNAL